MKRSVLTLLLLLCAPLLLFAQSVWQGSCAVGTSGSFPSSGLYGASNSFAQNTLVIVENLQTNQKSTVLIIDRLKNNGLFLLLSRDAGAAIGLSPGQVTQVSVTKAKQGISPFAGPGDLPYSPDSDIFPAAGAGNPKSLSFLDKYLKGTTGSAAPPQLSTAPAQGPPAASGATPKVSGVEEAAGPPAKTAAPPAAAPPSPQVAGSAQAGPSVTRLRTAETPAAPQPALVAQAEPIPPQKAGGAPVVSQLQPVSTPVVAPEIAVAGAPAVPEVRNPGPTSTALAAAQPPAAGTAAPLVAQLPQPPAQGGPRVSELAQATPPAAPAVASVSAVPGLPAETAAAGPGPIVSALSPASPPASGAELAAGAPPSPQFSGLKPEVTALAASSPPAGTIGPVTAVPAPEVGGAPGAAAAGPPKVAQAQPSPARPGTTPAAAAQPAAARQRAPLRPSSALTAGSYYVQLGAYFESSAALALADNLSPDYPVSVYSFEKGKKPMYKVMIGPLNSDESGTLLYLFIAQGYSGAFVRKGE